LGTGTCSRESLAGYFWVIFWVLEHVLVTREKLRKIEKNREKSVKIGKQFGKK